jgi:hypothetical protein
VKIGGLWFEATFGKKLNPHLNKLGIVVHGPSYLGGGDKRITFQGYPSKSTRPCLKCELKAKELGTWLKK